LSYSYEQYYQAVRRCWRFGQKKPVNAYIVAADSEGSVLDAINRKEQEHRKMQKEMSASVSKSHHELKDIKEPGLIHESGNNWDIYLGDCVIGARSIEDGIIDFSIYSPPFSNLYIYSDSIYDMGNSASDEEFFEHYRFLARELLRITRDGRLTAIHCKDLPLYKGRDGAAGLRDFPGQIIKMYEDEGWTYHSRVTIWKDPVIEMQRTKNHGLLYKQLCKDSSASRQGMADYIIVMRKWGDEEKWNPVTRDSGERFFDYIGSTKHGPAAKELVRARTEEERIRLYSINVWQRYASPVWFDIQQTNVLNIQQARDSNDEKHICPLQLDVIERCIELWSNPGELVFSPFAGIGSEGVVAIQQGRRFIGIELKPSYFNVAVENIKHAHIEQDDLFVGEL
jgi:DNA modification methylase